MKKAWLATGAGVLAAVLALAGTAASAAEPTRDVIQRTEVSCSLTDQETGNDLSLTAHYDRSGLLSEFGGHYVTGPEVLWPAVGDGSIDGAAWSLTLAFLGEWTETAGSLTVEGVVSSLTGDAQRVNERSPDGNAWTSRSGTVELLLISGTVRSADGAFSGLLGRELACQGAELDIEVVSSNPNASVLRNESGSTFCSIAEASFLVAFRLGEDYFVAYVEDVDLDGGTVGLVAEGVLMLDRGDLTGPLDVVWPEPPDGAAPDVVNAELMLGPRLGTSKYLWNEPFGAFRALYTDYALTGTLTRPDDGVVDIDCQFQEATSWERYTVSAGQKPGGRSPVNDLPEGAIELETPATLRTTTRGAAVAPEATCDLVFETPEGPVGEPVPLGRTVWYSLTGTGEEVHLTTAGSDFDTVVGVYDQSLDQIVCVDDADTPLAELTLATEPGAQYLIQVGGYNSRFGRLILSVD